MAVSTNDSFLANNRIVSYIANAPIADEGSIWAPSLNDVMNRLQAQGKFILK